MINIRKYSRFRRLIVGFIIILTLFISNPSNTANCWNGTTYVNEILSVSVKKFWRRWFSNFWYDGDNSHSAIPHEMQYQISRL